MRNGFNTAGFSEVVHEIKQDPVEAQFLYSAKGRRSGLTGLNVQILPALLGTIKSPRQFHFSLKDSWEEIPTHEMYIHSPMDLFLAGLGSCMMTTLVGGASARGLSLDGAKLNISAHPYSTVGSGGMFISAKFMLATVSEDIYCDEIIEQVSRQSPNYVTLDTSTPVILSYETLNLPKKKMADYSRASRAPVRFDSMEVTWISGTQCLASPSRGDSNSSLRADAPKQLTGVDWGPNPQEYLLAGLAAEMSGLLFKRSIGTSVEGHAWEVASTGREDVRGFLGTDPEIEVGLQDVEVLVTSPFCLSQEINDIVVQAFAESQIVSLLVNPIKIDVSWQRMDYTDLSPIDVLRPGIGE